MNSSPSSSILLYYACISKGNNTVIAEFNTVDDADLQNVASQCLQSAPPFHTTFSHTVRNKTYSFLMEDPFVYFAIFDQRHALHHGFQFLERLKNVFLNKFKSNLTSHCLQEEFAPVFHRLFDRTLSSSSSSSSTSIHNQNQGDHQQRHLDAPCSSNEVIVSVRSVSSSLEKKKKKNVLSDETVVNEGHNKEFEDIENGIANDNNTHEFRSSSQKNCHSLGPSARYYAQKKMWRKHVRTMLLIDLVVCCILFVAWLFICQGFECIATGERELNAVYSGSYIVSAFFSSYFSVLLTISVQHQVYCSYSSKFLLHFQQLIG